MDNKNQTPTLAVSLTVNNVAEALSFYQKALGAEESLRMAMPDGSIAHAEFKIGNSLVYISGEAAEWHAYAMPEETVSSSLLAILTDSCDKSYQKAVENGAKVIIEPVNQFWGMRTAVIKDPYGYRWSFREVVEEVNPEEMAKRAKEIFGS